MPKWLHGVNNPGGRPSTWQQVVNITTATSTATGTAAAAAAPTTDAFHAHLKRIAVRQLTDLDRDDIDNRRSL